MPENGRWDLTQRLKGLIMSKNVAPLNTYVINYVDCYDVIINLKHSGMCDFAINPLNVP
jgi:hypothetical protein